MDNQNTGEATPPNNTESPKFNPLTFDEAALAKVLKERFSGTEEKPVQNVEEQSPEPDAASAEDRAEEAEPTAEQTESQDESPEEVLSEDKNEDESLGFKKRIDKLTRQKKEALEKAEALERELNEAKSKLEQAASERPVAVASSQDPFADVWDEGKLNDEYSKARNLRRWCEDNSDGCEVDGKEYSAEDIKQIRRRVEDALDLHIPNRARFLQNYKQIKPIAEQLYPFWKDRSSTQYTEAQQVLRQLPQLSQLPEYQVLVGDFLEGRRLRLERESGKAKPALPVKRAPSQPGKPTAAPVKKDAATVQRDAAKSKFLKSGSVSELAQILKQF